MKLIIENWRRHTLNEAHGTRGDPGVQIYCDMDGVLVDFIAGVMPILNADLRDMSIPDRKPTGGLTKIGKLRQVMKESGLKEVTVAHISKGEDKMRHAIDYMIKRVGDDFEWWANLPWMPDGKELWDFIAPYNPTILTTPMGPDSEEGKRAWCGRHLGYTPDKVIMAPLPPGKSGWAATDRILIDDFYDTNIVPWDGAGGIGLYHTSAKETIQKLKEFGFGRR